MGIKAVWGFDPDEVAKAQNAFQRLTSEEEPEERGSLEKCAGIPSGADSQIYELRRVFRL